MKNPVARHINTFNKPSVVPCKRRLLQSEATLRGAAQSLSEEILDSETITFVSGSEVHWDESEDSLQGCLNDIGSSSILIDDCEEDEK